MHVIKPQHCRDSISKEQCTCVVDEVREEGGDDTHELDDFRSDDALRVLHAATHNT